MANEKRLISLDEALKATHSEIYWTESQQAAVRSFLIKQPKADAVEVVHAYWTGLVPDDYAFAEGFSDGMTPEERAKIHEDFIHTTHCSNCKGGFDDRWIRRWKYCPYCGAKMDGGNEDG